MKSLRILLILPFFSVFTQVGIASSFPQILEIFGNNTFYTSTFIAITPFVSMALGSFWGPILRKYGERKAFLTGLTGWGISFFFVALFLNNPILAIVFRGLQGLFDPLFFNIALTGVSKANIDLKKKSKYYGYVEIMGSLGAILGPLVLGTGFIYFPYIFLFALAIFLTIYGLFNYKNVDDVKIDYSKKEKKKFSPIIFLATIFGIITLIAIVSNQVIIPVYVESHFNMPVLGKILSSAFSLFVMFGNFIKHKIYGIKKWLPISVGIIIFASYLFISNPLIYLPIAIFSGLLLGLSLTMSSEYASILSKGFEDTGMSVFSSLRISGNIFGPYLAALSMPLVLISLAAMTIISAGLLTVSEEEGD